MAYTESKPLGFITAEIPAQITDTTACFSLQRFEEAVVRAAGFYMLHTGKILNPEDLMGRYHPVELEIKELYFCKGIEPGSRLKDVFWQTAAALGEISSGVQVKDGGLRTYEFGAFSAVVCGGLRVINSGHQQLILTEAKKSGEEMIKTSFTGGELRELIGAVEKGFQFPGQTQLAKASMDFIWQDKFYQDPTQTLFKLALRSRFADREYQSQESDYYSLKVSTAAKNI